MLKLTPLDETVAGKELIQIGKSQGLQEGREEGLEKGLEKGLERRSRRRSRRRSGKRETDWSNPHDSKLSQTREDSCRRVDSKKERRVTKPASTASISTQSLLSKLKQLFAKAAYFECSSLLEMMRSASHSFRDEKGRIAQYFQGLTQRRARIKSRMTQALATEELR